MSSQQPNILLLMPDQMRGDCLSLAGHPALLTPNIDAIGGNGVHFQRAYTTCASCIPARRALLTGQHPEHNGMVGFQDGLPIERPTLPQLLAEGGYATALVGRHMHQWPHDEPYGYQQQMLGSTYILDDDYARYLARVAPELGDIHGIGVSNNGWQAKPWPLEEHHHPTNWIAREARQLIAAHPDGRPLFATVSFYAPHPPLIPPAFYLERYLRQELPEAIIGSWETPPPRGALGAGVDAHETVLEGEALRYAQAGYYGLIHQLDDQLYWLIADFKARSRAMGRPWVIAFTSDHGEMLGDHCFFRKCEPYEGSSHIPLLIEASPELGALPTQTCDRPVCLEDLLPTFLELAGLPVPDGVDGVSLAPVLRGESPELRPWLHCEHSPCYSAQQAYHLLTDHRYKYIWRPLDGAEQLFDLRTDPGERHDLAGVQTREEELLLWRDRLVETLRDRPEGFVRDGELVPGRAYPAIIEG